MSQPKASPNAATKERSAKDRSIFGIRMREARQKLGLPQDKLGISIGLDEYSASARMSRYESGVHEPPIATAKLIAEVLKVPLAYLYCDDELLAYVILACHHLPDADKKVVVKSIEERLEALRLDDPTARRKVVKTEV